MAEDNLKDIQDGQGADKGQEHSKSDERSEDKTKKRFEDLSEKVRIASVALEEERKARKAAEFELGFEKLGKKYPKVSEVRDSIKKSVDAGLPLEDAAIAELHKSGNLITSEELAKQKLSNESVGGSADTKGVDKKAKSDAELSASEMRGRLVEMEERGEIRLTP